MFRDKAGREEAARRLVRGAYRKRGDKLKVYLVKQKKGMKYPAKGVQVTAGIIGGKIRFWRYVVGNWNSSQAVAMYTELEKTLAKVMPARAATPGNRWTVLEDNDPTGYKSSAARKIKKELRMDVLALPPRSPDMNTLDYYGWHAVNVRMREKEGSFAVDRRESEDEFKKRLRKTALSLPKAEVTKAVMDMSRRVKLLDKEKGGLFTE